jgi:lipopolysaccharide export system protein LptC
LNRRDRYSRMVALLKVLLPLAALAILSTLFLVARAMDNEAAIPFAGKEIQDRLRDQQITGPFFSGTTPDGDRISFSAVTLITLRDRVGTNRAENVLAKLETSQGATFQLQADVVELDMTADNALMSGDVSMVSSTGYRVNTATLTALVSALDVTAPQKVEATGPLGVFTAGNMRIFTPKDTDGMQMIFSNGVKLVYTP